MEKKPKRGEFAEAAQRLEDLIYARVGSLAEFAKRIERTATQVTASLRGDRRLTTDTLDRWAAALELPDSNMLREWYGYTLPELPKHNGDGRSPAPLALPPRDADTVPLAQKVADVEARRGEHYQARLREARATMSRPQYEAWCAALWGMWGGNAEMVFTLLDRGLGDE